MPSGSILLPVEKERFLDGLRSKCHLLWALGQVRRVVIRPSDLGFFGAFLGVLDTLLMAPPQAQVRRRRSSSSTGSSQAHRLHARALCFPVLALTSPLHTLQVLVDWRLTGTERHFTYDTDPSGRCVWCALFAPLHRPAATGSDAPPSDETLEVSETRFNCLLGRFKIHFRGSRFAEKHRRLYHDVYARWVRVRHPIALGELSGLGAVLKGGASIGVHKRVDTAGTAENQG